MLCSMLTIENKLATMRVFVEGNLYDGTEV